MSEVDAAFLVGLISGIAVVLVLSAAIAATWWTASYEDWDIGGKDD